MKVIAVCHQKGGVGKSTIAQAVAVGSPKKSRIFDADAQGTSGKFVTQRITDGRNNPDLASGRIENLRLLVEQAEKDGVEWFVIDTPPEQATEVNLRAALSVADFAILPTKASANDVEVLPKTINVVRQLDVPFGIVINEFDGRRSLHKQVSNDLKELVANNGGHFFAPLRNLAVHQEATFARECAIEYAPSSNGAREMTLLVRELVGLLKGI